MRVYNIVNNDKHIKNNKIVFCNEKYESDENFFSLLIGINGTGKSRLLGNIARQILEFQKEKTISFFEELSISDLPRKLIAVTNSISDKFPIDDTFRPDNFKELCYSDLYYIYLGTRNKANSFSSKTLMDRALEILFENYKNQKTASSYRYIFDYLNYKPVIKVSYKYAGSLLKKIKNKEDISVEELEEILKPNYYKKMFIGRSIENIINNKNELKEICYFINNEELFNNNGELLVDFSEENIKRISSSKKHSTEKINKFKIINLLKKTRSITEIEIYLHKNNGEVVNFSNSSSGESSILCTLIGLIPLLENNSLILIDEPEISLHPNWQNRYIELLQQIFSKVKGCHIIIATHSHFLVSDLPLGNSSVISLKIKNGEVESELINEPTFGWSAENILLNIFDLPTTRNYYLSQLVTKALELFADHNRSNSELEEVKNKIKDYFPIMKNEDPLKDIIKAILNSENK